MAELGRSNRHGRIAALRLFFCASSFARPQRRALVERTPSGVPVSYDAGRPTLKLRARHPSWPMVSGLVHTVIGSIMQQSALVTSRNSSHNAVLAKATARDSENVRRLGYDMGVLSAAYWSAVRSSDRFKHMTIADYRDSGVAECQKTLADQSCSDDFVTGFMMGFEDEACHRAEACLAGYEDVREAGSVDGSVAVTARRLLKLAAVAGLRLN